MNFFAYATRQKQEECQCNLHGRTVRVLRGVFITGDDDDADDEMDVEDVESDAGEEGEGARSRASPSPPPVMTPGGELAKF